MKKSAKSKIVAILILISFALTTIIISDYVASFYENRNEAIPNSVSIILLVIFVCGLGPVCTIFNKAFSKEK